MCIDSLTFQDDGARNSPFPKHSGAYSATPPKSTPAVLPKTAHATHRSIKRSSLQLSSARDESEIKGHPQDAPSPGPRTYEPVDAPTGDSHETAIPDPAVPTADSHLSASALVPASPHRPASEPPASEPPVSQTAPDSVPEPVPYAESMPQPSETVPQPEQASEKASDKPADPADHAPEEQPNRIDGVIHKSSGTYHATATPPGSDPIPVKKPSEAPGTEAKDTSTTKVPFCLPRPLHSASGVDLSVSTDACTRAPQHHGHSTPNSPIQWLQPFHMHHTACTASAARLACHTSIHSASMHPPARPELSARVPVAQWVARAASRSPQLGSFPVPGSTAVYRCALRMCMGVAYCCMPGRGLSVHRCVWAPAGGPQVVQRPFRPSDHACSQSRPSPVPRSLLGAISRDCVVLSGRSLGACARNPFQLLRHVHPCSTPFARL